MSIRAFVTVAIAYLLCVRAEAAPKSWAYARDEKTEFTITVNAEATGKPHLTLRMFGTAAEGMILDIDSACEPLPGGGLKALSGDSKDESVRISGQPGAPVLTVKAGKLPRFDDREKDVDVSGSYKLLSEGAVLERAKARFEAADAQLNADYKALVAALKPDELEELKDLQLKWIARRDSGAEAETGAAEKPKEQLAYWDKLLELTSTRLEFLKVYSRKGIPKGVTATYRDFDGGWLHLEERKTGLAFSLEVLRGPSLHSGFLEGVVKRSGKLATFRETVPKEETREPAEVTFTFVTDNKVQVEAKNAGFHAGARAYFDGLYFKAHALEAGLSIE